MHHNQGLLKTETKTNADLDKVLVIDVKGVGKLS